MYNELQQKILQWLGNGRVGLSSKAMAFAVAEVEIKDKSHPYDPDDLNRCLLFLEAVPEARNHFDKIAALSETWARLIERWEDVEKSFIDEVGLNWCKAHSAPITYDLMKSIIR